MIGLLIAVAVVIAGVPFAAVVLVSVASCREDSAGSLAGPAPGPFSRAARRLLGFQSAGICQPSSRARPRRAPAMSGLADAGRGGR
ncbi:MAG TPA: hypothetical protein VMK13_13855 [Streptosporangiaceae bacterium]|nr:hypothetical protein [Streptosporangiaceae bacterium]